MQKDRGSKKSEQINEMTKQQLKAQKIEQTRMELFQQQKYVWQQL
jgi:hypothetical protein